MPAPRLPSRPAPLFLFVGDHRFSLGGTGEHRHHALRDQRRTGEAPLRNGRSGIGHDIARPEKLAAGRVEAVQMTVGPERVQPPGVKRGRRPRTGPPANSENRVASWWAHTSFPVVAS